MVVEFVLSVGLTDIKFGGVSRAVSVVAKKSNIRTRTNCNDTHTFTLSAFILSRMCLSTILTKKFKRNPKFHLAKF